MKPLLLCAAVFPALAGCAALATDPARIDFRATVGADDWPMPLPEPLAVPVLDAPASAATGEEIGAWCEALASEDADERDRAMSGLLAAGNASLPRLVPLRASEDAEVAARASALVERILFGDVEALRARVRENLEPGDPIVDTLEARLDRRMEVRESAVEVLGAIRDANLRGGLGDPTAPYRRGLLELFAVLAGSPAGERDRRRRAAGYDDPGDPAALNACARIARFGLRSRDVEVRKAALGAVSAMSVSWQASLFGELLALKSDPALAERALEIMASAARAGADGVACPSLSTVPGPPIGPTNVAAALVPLTPELLRYALDDRNPAPARIWALEAASYSGEPGMAAQIAELGRDPRFQIPVFDALVVLGGPEAEEAIVGALRRPLAGIPAESAESAAARRGIRAAVPILADRAGERARVCAVVGAVAGPEDAGTVVALLRRSTQVDEIRPLLGALVRLSPLPGPHELAAREAVRALLSSENPDLRFLSSCALSALDSRDGIAAWGPLLEDGALVTVTWPGWSGSWSLQDYAPVALEQLTGMEFVEEDPLPAWREWWEAHRAEYGRE